MMTRVTSVASDIVYQGLRNWRAGFIPCEHDLFPELQTTFDENSLAPLHVNISLTNRRCFQGIQEGVEARMQWCS